MRGFYLRMLLCYLQSLEGDVRITNLYVFAETVFRNIALGVLIQLNLMVSVRRSHQNGPVGHAREQSPQQ